MHRLHDAAGAPDTLDLRTVERLTIERALRVTGGNLSRAARLLGIDRSTLRRKLGRYARARRDAGDVNGR